MHKLPDDAHEPRSSRNPDRRGIFINLTPWEFETVTVRAALANLSKPRYAREAMLALPILRTTSPAEILPHTARATVCVRALVQTTAASLDVMVRRRLEASMSELHRTADELQDHTVRLAAVLSLLPPP